MRPAVQVGEQLVQVEPVGGAQAGGGRFASWQPLSKVQRSTPTLGNKRSLRGHAEQEKDLLVLKQHFRSFLAT